MSKRLAFLAACCVMLIVPIVSARQQVPPPSMPPPGTPQPTAVAPAAAPVPAPASVFRTVGEPVTVRIDLTITDQVGTAAPLKKTMTLLAADGERASVRSINRSPGQNNAQFNVDARPVLAKEKIRLDLSVIYDPPEIPRPGTENERDSSGKPMNLAWSTSLQESMGVVLENGKPMIVSQSADPRTDRKVTVEVKATVLK